MSTKKEFEEKFVKEIKDCVNDPDFWDHKTDSIHQLLSVSDFLKDLEESNFFQKYYNKMLNIAEETLKDCKEPGTYLTDVSHLLAGDNLSYQNKQFLRDRFVNSSAGTGKLFMYGYKITYTDETGIFYAKDVHIADVSIKKERNRPVAYIAFKKGIDVPYAGYDEKMQDDGSALYRMSACEMEGFLLETVPAVLNADDHDKYAVAFTRFSNDSVREWHSFQDECDIKNVFVDMTDAMSKAYANSYSNLRRYMLNYRSFVDEFSWPVNDITVIETSWAGVYVDGEITEEEVEFACTNCEGSSFAKDVRRQYKAMNDETDGHDVVEKFNSKVQTVQDIIQDDIEKDNRIMRKLKESVGLPEDSTSADLHEKEMQYGFDCGFLYFYFKDEETMELAKTAACYDGGKSFKDGSFSLNIPYECQSITFQRYQGEEICRMAKEHGIDLGCFTHLD